MYRTEPWGRMLPAIPSWLDILDIAQTSYAKEFEKNV